MSRVHTMAASAAALAISALGIATPVSAAAVTQCGPNICYSYDDAQAAVALFGLPTLVGNSLVFLPPDFRAESSDGAGIQTSTANFVFSNVYSADGVSEIQNIVIVEFGDYEITNGDRVAADLLLSVVNLTPSPSFPFFPEFGSSQASFDAFGDSIGLQTWQMSTNFNAAEQFNASAHSLSMTIQNTLTAETTDLGENAWIQKKITVTGVVPLPAAVWLFASGLGLLGWIRARRS